MKFLSCRDEGSVRTEEQDPTEKRALLNASSATCVPGTPGSDGLGGGATPDTYKPVKLRVFSLTELESATGGFGMTSLIGKGSHGRLYKGTLKDGRVVAIKRQEFLQDEAAFNNELEILSTLHGPRLVNLVGFSRGLDAQEKLLVVDYMSNGTLYDALHHRDGGSPSSGSSSANHSASHSTTSSGCSSVSSVAAAGPLAEPLGWSLRVQIALQTAKALLVLHSASPPVIHRDVKSSSVLIDSKWNAKLGDFGLALRGCSEEELRGKGSGGEGQPGQGDGEAEATAAGAAAGIMDPEDDTQESRISTKADVFSFGILLLEILSGRNAIDVRFKPPSIIDWALPLIKQGKAHAIYDRRLILLPHYSKALRLMAGIAARCVRRCSLRRPSMDHVVAALQDVSKKIPMAKWADGLATVMKMTTSGCQTPHVLRDVRTGHELNSSFHSNHQRRNSVSPASQGGGMTAAQIAKQRQSVDRPMPSGKALPLPPPHKALEQQDYYMNVALNRFVSRANSMDRAAAVVRSRELYRGGSTRIPREVDFVGGPGQGLGQSGSNRHHFGHQRSLSRQDSKRSDTYHQFDGDYEDEDKDKDDKVGVEEAAKRLPRATMEVSLGGRKRIYNQWRNPIFDVETGSSPERPLVVPVEVARPLPRAAQRVAHGHGAGTNSSFRLNDDAAAHAERRAATGGGQPPYRQSSTTITTRIVPSSSTPPPAPASGPTSAPAETPAASSADEESTCMPAIPLSMSNKVRSRNVRSSSRKSHIKTRDNFEREEAMLPW